MTAINFNTYISQLEEEIGKLHALIEDLSKSILEKKITFEVNKSERQAEYSRKYLQNYKPSGLNLKLDGDISLLSISNEEIIESLKEIFKLD